MKTLAKIRYYKTETVDESIVIRNFSLYNYDIVNRIVENILTFLSRDIKLQKKKLITPLMIREVNSCFNGSKSSQSFFLESKNSLASERNVKPECKRARIFPLYDYDLVK